ncbi:MAG: hypothetical protein PF445_10690 [Melioribacteraceae bacterium]|nr:hypothetical protein [Melioribacteraceae bacterium]
MKTETISSVEKISIISNIGKALIAGVGGYILFLGILFATKTISMYLQPEGSILFEMTDFVLPLIGFCLLFLIKFLENLKVE